MNTKLKQIQDWPQLARQARWSAAMLAKLCNISTDTLCRHFLVATGKTTRQWLVDERQRQALVLLRDGSTVKETAMCLGYKQQTNFTRKFKKFHGVCPSVPATGRFFASDCGKMINQNSAQKKVSEYSLIVFGDLMQLKVAHIDSQTGAREMAALEIVARTSCQTLAWHPQRLKPAFLAVAAALAQCIKNQSDHTKQADGQIYCDFPY